MYNAYCISVHVDVQYNQNKGGANQEHTLDEVQSGIRVSEGNKTNSPDSLDSPSKSNPHTHTHTHHII